MSSAKVEITMRSYLDGVLKREWTEQRVVRNGHISRMGRYTVPVRDENGTLVVEFHARTIGIRRSP